MIGRIARSARPVIARRFPSVSGVHARSMCDAASELEPREAMEFDVVIVGAGPAGLSASIKLMQLAQAEGKELSVCVVEKGAEVGSHILSGNVFEPRALEELFPDYLERGAPLQTKVVEDKFVVLNGPEKSFGIPHALLPPQINNDGNYIISLGQLVRWLGNEAEELGVQIFPGFSAGEVLYTEDGTGVRGVATTDMGIDKDGSHKSTYARGMELVARQTLFSEGCRGSCSESIISKFNLRGEADADEQTYGLGIKEIWEIPEENHKPGYVQHSLGWPLQSGLLDKTFGGSFLYHMEPNLVLVGLVVGLDYANPYLSPYEEFQRFKTHPAIKDTFKDGKCISYGARVLNEGGYYSIPKLTFPGGALVGCSAGFLNALKVKGSHTAMKSGMVAAEEVFGQLVADATEEEPLIGEGGEIAPTESPKEVSSYQTALDQSWVMEELKAVRNFHGGFHYGVGPGMAHAGLVSFITRGAEPWSLRNRKKDCERTGLAKDHEPIEYPKPDGVLTFDLLSNLARSGTNHADQPSHLKVKPEQAHMPERESMEKFAAPESRFCPARVYEYTDGSENEEGRPQLVINAQNCVHCKCCSIKTPNEFINWTVPEGGGGPGYEIM